MILERKPTIILVKQAGENTMQRYIETLKSALETLGATGGGEYASALADHLAKRDSTAVWKQDYPISVVHDCRRIKVQGQAAALEGKGLVAHDGLTPQEWSGAMLEDYEATGSPMQTVDMAVLQPAETVRPLSFMPKRPQDYWKRLVDVDDLNAVISFGIMSAASAETAFIDKQLMESANGQWYVESDLRDAMRSKKENGALRPKPFIWVGIVDGASLVDCAHVETLAGHYFGEAVLSGSGAGFSYVIGYSESLEAISLRKFYKLK
jgi:hypothetical protein